MNGAGAHLKNYLHVWVVAGTLLVWVFFAIATWFQPAHLPAFKEAGIVFLGMVGIVGGVHGTKEIFRIRNGNGGNYGNGYANHHQGGGIPL